MNPEDKPNEIPVTNEAAAPQVTQSAVTGDVKKSTKKPILIVLALLVLLGAGAFGYTQLSKKDNAKPTPVAQNQAANENDTTDAEETVSEIPDGYKKYENVELGVSFAYPEEWGGVTVEQSREDQAGHNATGNWEILTFSQNENVKAGLKSSDWSHDDTGHDGIPDPGSTSLEESKKAKEYIKANTIYVDNESEFAYVSVCGIFCSEELRTLLQYIVAVEGNAKYSTLEFYYYGDQIESKYLNKDDDMDMSKAEAVLTTELFPKTDSRFVILQKIAGTVKKS